MRRQPEALARRHLQQSYPEADEAAVSAALARSGGWLGQAQELLEGGEIPPQTADFVRSFAARDTMGLVNVLVPMEKWKRDALIDLLTDWQMLLVLRQ